MIGFEESCQEAVMDDQGTKSHNASVPTLPHPSVQGFCARKPSAVSEEGWINRIHARLGFRFPGGKHDRV